MSMTSRLPNSRLNYPVASSGHLLESLGTISNGKCLPSFPSQLMTILSFCLLSLKNFVFIGSFSFFLKPNRKSVIISLDLSLPIFCYFLSLLLTLLQSPTFSFSYRILLKEISKFPWRKVSPKIMLYNQNLNLDLRLDFIPLQRLS